MKVLPLPTKKINKNKGEYNMKLTKKKVLVLALAVSLIAVASMGTLAWFSASDEVTNNFYIANSEDDPDKIFSVDVWEDATPADPAGETPDQDGIEFENILPGNEYFKEAHIENTGSYDQYIRATITVTDASVWQDVFGMRLVPVTEFVNVDLNTVHTQVAYYDAANDSFVYELYLTDVLAVGNDVVIFDTAYINENLDRFQAADLEGSFAITVVADAVQTENVGANVYEAFNTVGLVKAAPISNPADLAAALASDEEAYLIIDPAALTAGTLTIDGAIENKTLDFAGANANVVFTAAASAENVVISGLVDDDSTGFDITAEAGFTGTVTVTASTFDCGYANNGVAINPVSGNFIIDNCIFNGVDKSNGVYTSGSTAGDITITNCTFNNLGTWAIMVNGAVNGSLTVDNCTFDTKDGVLKTLGGGITGDFTFTNNTLIGVKGHDGDSAKIIIVPVVGGTKTVSGNTFDGADWTF